MATTQNTQKHGFSCDDCGAQFLDGLDAGHHEIETGHRTSHDNVEVKS